MVLPIYIYGQPVLRKVAEKISPDYPELKELIDNMFETMYKAEGIGLAAPQVGFAIRLLVIDASPAADEDNPDLQNFKRAFINPEILELTGDEWAYNEGCLSLPDIREDVMRPAIVKVRYYDENFQMHEEVFDGMKARIFQHEYDHIEGKLFIDKINPIRRRMISGKLRAMTKGKVNPIYKIKQ